MSAMGSCRHSWPLSAQEEVGRLEGKVEALQQVMVAVKQELETESELRAQVGGRGVKYRGGTDGGRCARSFTPGLLLHAAVVPLSHSCIHNQPLMDFTASNIGVQGPVGGAAARDGGGGAAGQDDARERRADARAPGPA